MQSFDSVRVCHLRLNLSGHILSQLEYSQHCFPSFGHSQSDLKSYEGRSDLFPSPRHPKEAHE